MALTHKMSFEPAPFGQADGIIGKQAVRFAWCGVALCFRREFDEELCQIHLDQGRVVDIDLAVAIHHGEIRLRVESGQNESDS